MIIITGLGRTGTSFMAKVFIECGYEIGDQWFEDINAGHEIHTVVKINKFLIAGNTETEDVKRKMLEVYSKYPIIKDPRFVLDNSFGNVINTWVNVIGKENIKIILTTRDFCSVFESRNKVSALRGNVLTSKDHIVKCFAEFINNISRLNIPFELFHFPDFLSYTDKQVRQKFKKLDIKLHDDFFHHWNDIKDERKITF